MPWLVAADDWEEWCDIELALYAGLPEWREVEFALCSLPVLNDPRCGFVYWCSRYWFLRDKRNVRRRLVPNALQRIYLRHRSGENVILKARKMGASTLVDALYYWRALFNPTQHLYIMAHKATSTDELYQRVLTGHRELPEWMRPPTDKSNAKELRFASNGSHIRVLTAGGPGSGRSGDADGLHLSEVAHYPDAKSVLAAAGESVRDGAWMDLESTPNGMEEFYAEFNGARAGTTGRTGHFFPWWVDAHNRAPVPGDGPLELTADEAQLRELHGLDDEQIAWRRLKQAKLGELFPQEHPEDDTTCFLTSGIPKFDNVLLAELLKYVEARVQPLRVRGAPFGGSDNGRFTCWVLPQPGHEYVVGADVAEGLPTGAYSAAGVLDVTTMEQVAAWHGHVEPGDFGHVLGALGTFYNEALVAPERNNHGHATLRALKVEVGYPHIYRHRYFDQRRGKAGKRPGWPTDGRTRPIMMTELRRCLDNGHMIVRDAEFLRECMAMQAGDESETERDELEGARKGRKVWTDRVIAWAIAWQVREQSVPAVV